MRPSLSLIRGRGIVTAAASWLVLVLLAGCSSGSDPDPYAARFAQAMAATDNEFVRQVLSDGKISASELQDAQQRTLDCMSAAGAPGSFDTDEYGLASLSFSGDLSAAQNVDVATCSIEWSNDIVALYNDKTQNPNNADLDDLVASCLVRKGLAPEGFTGQDYKQLAESNSVHMDTSTMDTDQNGGMVIIPADPDAVEILLPGGQPLDQGEALRCLWAPLQ